MSKLDVIRLHTGLQTDFGLDAGYLSDVSSTSSTFLLSPNGLPCAVGWFDNSKKSLKSSNVYALTTHPDEPRNMHHRIILQHGRNDVVATFIEEDCADYLEGYDDYPTISQSKHITQPEIDETIRSLSVGAYVLNASVGKSHENFAWENEYDVSAVTEHGLEIIGAGDVLAVIDADTLDRYAQITPPVLH